MPKAYLTGIDMEMGIADRDDIMNMSGRVVASYYGPRRYSYTLRYISMELMDTNDFPNEIDTENLPPMIENKSIQLEKLD